MTEETIFAAALERKNPAERAAYLAGRTFSAASSIPRLRSPIS